MAKSRDKKPSKQLSLHALNEGVGNITPAVCEAMGEAAAVCLENQQHSEAAEFPVTGTWRRRFELDWSPATQKVKKTWSDLQDATEQGACGISFLLVRELTEYTIIERSVKGTGFDYWLGTDDDLFQRKVRLEISGILTGDERAIQIRVRDKLHQTDQSSHTKLPAMVSVVEFGKPTAKLVQK